MRSKFAPAAAGLFVALTLLLGAETPPAQQSPPAPPDIPLQRDLRFVIRPTVLGLVPPGDPQGFGECFVRVTAVEGPRLTAHYEIKEAQPDETAPVHRPAEEVRIRRGEVTASLDVPRFDPPLFWADGSWQTDSALLWLPQSAYAELSSSGVAEVQLGPPPPADDDALGQALAELIAQRRAMYGLAADDGGRLIVRDWRARYPVYVNGERADLPAIVCTDSIELAEYWILADPDNPLLLKMTLQVSALDAAAAELPADPASALVAQGSGFAVMSIDF